MSLKERIYSRGDLEHKDISFQVCSHVFKGFTILIATKGKSQDQNSPNHIDLITQSLLTFAPSAFFASAAMTLPRLDRLWLILAPSFSLSPVAPVASALSLNYC